jgi:lipoprotein-releasing system permease protein
MFKSYPFFIGLRYSSVKRKNHFVSFISRTSMIGLTLGVAVLITVLSVMNGFERELQHRILGMVPHAIIKEYGTMHNWKKVAATALKFSEVEAAAPIIQAQGMVTHGGGVSGILINGIDPKLQDKVSIVSQHMVAGSIHNLKPGKFGIVIGNMLASSLQVGLGDKVTVVLPEASITPAGVFPRLKRFTVVGIFKVGAELDDTLTMINIQDAAKILRLNGGVQGVRLKLKNLFDAAPVSQVIAQKLGMGYYAEDWTRTQGNLFQAIKMEKTMIGLLLMMIVAVAAFNIVSTLVMVVTDKKADIAILRTMGASPQAIMGIFIVQGAYIGVLGNLFGTVLGVLAALNVSDFFTWLEKITHHQFLSSDVYFISYLPSQLQWQDVTVICLSGFAMSMLATLYPAWRASRIEPAEALRYE